MKTSARSGWMVAAGLALGMAGWWTIRRLWLAKEATEAEPPARPDLPPDAPAARVRSISSRPDPVDEAIAESFPASDPPSFVGGGRT